MEIASLVTAVVIGLVVGALGWLLMPTGRLRALGAAVGVGVVAAATGTVVARTLEVARSPGVDWLELAFQLSFAAAGVAAVAGAMRSRRTIGAGRGTT